MESLERRETVRARQSDVEQHEIQTGMLLYGAARLLGVARLEHVDVFSERFERVPHALPHHRMIVDDKYFHVCPAGTLYER